MNGLKLTEDSDAIDRYDAIAYDIVWAYAFATDALLAAGKPLNGDNMLEYLRLVNFTGITGQFSFNQLGERAPRYEILNYAKNESVEGVQQTVIGSWSLDSTRNVNLTIDSSAFVPIYWPSGTDRVPNFNPQRKFWSCHEQRSGRTK